MLGGVCGGIAHYVDIDPTIVRLLAVVITLVGNVAAVIVYVVMWIAVPEEPLSVVPAGTSERSADMSEGSDRSQASAPGPDAPPPPPPYAPAASPAAQHEAGHTPQRGRGGAWFGAVLVLVGTALLVQIFFPQVRLWEYWPVIVIVAGVLMIVRSGGGGPR